MISFIVPALNEEQNIGPTVETIISAAEECDLRGYEIILIDDGSTDGTHAAMVALANRNPLITVFSHGRNLGIGASYRRGIDTARCPRFMFVPGDNDLAKSFIVLLLTFRDEADMILTVSLNKELRSRARNVVSTIYQMIYMVTFDIFVGYLNGPGIWPTEKARAMRLEAARFSIISEMNVKLLRSGCSYAELPGYFQAGPKARRTITWSNFREVIGGYLSLVYKVFISHKKDFASRPTRVQIDFTAAMRPNRKIDHLG